MIMIMNANDFEFYSANSAGGFQGNGYQCRNAGYVCDIRVMTRSIDILRPDVQSSFCSYRHLHELVSPRPCLCRL